MMYKELKKAIIDWLMEHENEWHRVNSCRDAFCEYVFGKDGNYLIGGKDVDEFISAADKLIYGRSEI